MRGQGSGPGPHMQTCKKESSNKLFQSIFTKQLIYARHHPHLSTGATAGKNTDKTPALTFWWKELTASHQGDGHMYKQMDRWMDRQMDRQRGDG